MAILTAATLKTVPSSGLAMAELGSPAPSLKPWAPRHWAWRSLGLCLPGALPSQTLQRGSHFCLNTLSWNASKLSVTWLSSLGWRPGVGTEPRWQGDVPINSMWEVLSPERALSPPAWLSALNPGRDQQRPVLPCVTQSQHCPHPARALPACASLQRPVSLVGGKPDLLPWPPGVTEDGERQDGEECWMWEREAHSLPGHHHLDSTSPGCFVPHPWAQRMQTVFLSTQKGTAAEKDR